MPPMIEKNIKLWNYTKTITCDTPMTLICVHMKCYFVVSVRLSKNPLSSLDLPKIFRQGDQCQWKQAHVYRKMRSKIVRQVRIRRYWQ